MLGPQLFQPSPNLQVAVGAGRRAAASPPSPRQNRLLAALSAGDYERLLPHLEPFPMPLGRTVHGSDDPEDHLYFLTAGIVSRFGVATRGASNEFAVTGSEGVIGVASFLGGRSTPTRAIVLSPGHAYRLGADVLERELEHDGPLPRLLLRYVRALMAQIGQIAACSRHHTLDQRLCRWILSCLDRLPSSELAMTQQLIARVLGVRREGVTEAAGSLQEAGLIHCHRGTIVVLDRPRLEARACECYAVVRRAYDGLLGPSDTTGSAGRSPRLAPAPHWVGGTASTACGCD